MKYTVAELDAMPVGTVLMNIGGPTGKAIMHPTVMKSWTGWHAPTRPDDAAIPADKVAQMDFTHRADPAPAQDAPVSEVGG